MFEKIKRWYSLGLWTKQQVHDAVPDLISAEEYEEITHETFIPDEDPEDEQQEKAEAFDILMGEDNG